MEKYPDFKRLFPPKDLEVMRKALENQTSISRNSLSRIEIAIARLNVKIAKLIRIIKNQKLVVQVILSHLMTSLILITNP